MPPCAAISATTPSATDGSKTAAVLGYAGIVHDDGAAACRNELGVRGAKAPPRPGDDSDLAVEANCRHG